MKVIYFVTHGKPTLEDRAIVEKMRSEQHKAHYSNGSVQYGFEDSCDAVFLASDFPHIESWAVSKGIQVMKPEPVAVAPEPEPVEPEPTVEPEPKPKRAGRPKTTPSE